SPTAGGRDETWGRFSSSRLLRRGLPQGGGAGGEDRSREDRSREGGRPPHARPRGCGGEDDDPALRVGPREDRGPRAAEGPRALAQRSARAPFAEPPAALPVGAGNRGRGGQTSGTVVAKESEPALSGAGEMPRQAATPADRSDAERAVALAEKNLVPRPLLAT